MILKGTANRVDNSTLQEAFIYKTGKKCLKNNIKKSEGTSSLGSVAPIAYKHWSVTPEFSKSNPLRLGR